MIKPNPKNYDFLWLLNNITYLETTLWIREGFLKRNFIITSKGSEFKTYIGKKERIKLSKIGLIFLQKHFSKYKKEAENKIKQARLHFKKIKDREFFSFSNQEFIKTFLQDVKFAQTLWKLYFYTEYFLYDKVDEKIRKNPKKNNELLKKVQEMQKLKFKLRDIINQTVFPGHIFENYFREIKRRNKINNINSFHYQELVGLLKDKKIKKINRETFVLGKFNNWKPTTGKRALKIIKAFDKILLQEIQKKKLKGQIANRGFYKGRVKIIPVDIKKNLAKEISKMKKGDILVTGTTGPEMILACRKAGAIVTEEGGICSHAAIVSRELNIPCVIGTKIATQVLKDGDLIEVDANNGIVKIL